MILKSNPEALNIFRRILYRSTFYAVSAYFIFFILERLIMLAGAAMYGYSANITYKAIKIKADFVEWNQESVLIIYLLPYIIQAIILVLLYANLQRRMSKPGYLRIFTLWMMFFIVFRLLGMLPVHLYYKTGIYHAFNWLYVGLALKILIGFTGIVLFFLSSVRILNGVFFFFGTFNNNNKEIGLKNLSYSSLLVPALASCIIPLLFFLPGLPKEEMIGLILLMLPLIYVLLRLIITDAGFLPSRIWVEENNNPLRFFLVVLLVIIILRIILGIGFSFN